ncbi:hypothetical protein [Paenibacillus zanthoxyli]|uniref:hypothetical protein n=1 Tax=Paenibacillus zanthoxyli TaxID=369399 RepID=UPI000472E7D9|nr:hypothetical protein [Paenibacillus zanthoxyli]
MVQKLTPNEEFEADSKEITEKHSPDKCKPWSKGLFPSKRKKLLLNRRQPDKSSEPEAETVQEGEGTEAATRLTSSNGKLLHRLSDMGIKGKLFLFVIVSIVIIFSIMAGVIYSNTKKLIVDDLRQALDYEKRQISSEVNELFMPAGGSVELLGANAFVRDFISSVSSPDAIKTTEGYSSLIHTLNLTKDNIEHSPT